MLKPIILIVSALYFVSAGQEANFEDSRCRCICPSLAKFLDVPDNSTEKPEVYRRRFYTKTNIEPMNCKPKKIVENEVLHVIDDSKMDAFLANCDCRYESRNTVLLKVVVIFVICVIAVLTGYMLFLMCLDPMLRKKRLSISYQQHNDEMEENIFAANSPDEDSQGSSTDPGNTTRARNNVLGRVEAEQNRWMKKVEAQRRNIFEDHTMLN